MKMITRINPETGREEFWNQPKGLPGIWMTRGFCDRCKSFNKCMGLLNLSDVEWKTIEDFIDEMNENQISEVLFDLNKMDKCSI